MSITWTPATEAMPSWNSVTETVPAWTNATHWVQYGPPPTYVSATQFRLSGNQSAIFYIGRRLKTINSGGTIYSTIASVALVIGPIRTSVVVVNDSGILDSGLSSVSYEDVASWQEAA